jgi:hypothetical protein
MESNEILANVIRELDKAEEFDGPEGNDYVNLMTAIAREALSRIENFAQD